MNFNGAESSIAVIQFIELLSIISVLSIGFVIFLLFYLKSREKRKALEEQNKKEKLVTETITRVQENERKRISTDLHDTVTQDIRTALLFVRKLENSTELNDEQKNILLKIQKIEEQNLRNIRHIIRNLTPAEIANANFVQLLSEFCENTSEAGEILVKFHAEHSQLFLKLTAEQKLHIFRIVQESVNNALKHSEAEEISVIVREENDGTALLFLISDDGKGFTNSEEITNAYNDLENATEKSILNESTHLGLRGMKSRAEILGAKLEIRSDSETGTQVKLVMTV